MPWYNPLSWILPKNESMLYQKNNQKIEEKINEFKGRDCPECGGEFKPVALDVVQCKCKAGWPMLGADGSVYMEWIDLD